MVAATACGDDDGPTKPDPRTVLSLAAQVGVPVDRVALVSDTPADLDMARAAGVGRVVGVRSGITDGEELAPHADVLLSSVGELIG
jgi:phosphoglycolate phosphatase